MKNNILNRLIIALPVLYILCRWLWGIVQLDALPSELESVIRDFAGPCALAAIIVFVLVKFLWRIPILNECLKFLLGTNPCLQGTWEGTLYYTYENRKRSKTVFLVIKQSDGYSLNIWFLTDERTSTSSFACIDAFNGSQRLIYEYTVADSAENKERNPLHSGFCQLIFDANSKKRLSGLYYTSRHTTGEMEFTEQNQKVVITYKDAVRL
jgi:hypothetical protein